MPTTDYNQYNDLELVANYKQTSNNAFVGVLYQRYTHLIFGVCMKYFKNEQESEDASIQIFEKLLNDLKNHEINHFKSWLYMVCKNYCLMQLRSQTGKLKKEKEYNYFMESEQLLHPNDEGSKELELTLMEECIKILNLEQKVCVELFYLQELSYQQIVDKTNYNLNNVKSYIQNGKRNLKNCIESKSIAQQIK